jgi:hypothetical protein
MECLNLKFKNRGKIFMLLSFLITVGQVVLGGPQRLSISTSKRGAW